MKKLLVKKPWGSFKQFTLNEKSTVKILTISPNKRFSLQKHRHRKEFWRFLDSNAIVTIGNKKAKAKKGSEFIIKENQLHRIQALNKEVNVLEISFGNFNEKDIQRVEDDFGRA